MAHVKSDLRNRILGMPCLEEASTVNDHRDNKDLILASDTGLIWEYSDGKYCVVIRSPKVVNREFELKGSEKHKRGEEHQIIVCESEAKEWVKKLRIEIYQNLVFEARSSASLTTSFTPSTNLNLASIISAINSEPLSFLHLFCAHLASWKTIARVALVLPHPFVFRVLKRTVANMDSIGLVDRM